MPAELVCEAAKAIGENCGIRRSTHRSSVLLDSTWFRSKSARRDTPHRLERYTDDTPAAFAFDFHPILSPARNELATWTANVAVVGLTLVL
jgi:hypothetical protein